MIAWPDGYDPTGDLVETAWTDPTARAPAVADWKVSAWAVLQVGAQPGYFALSQVGPGSQHDLAAGRYKPWVRITTADDVPMLQPSGELVIQ